MLPLLLTLWSFGADLLLFHPHVGLRATATVEEQLKGSLCWTYLPQFQQIDTLLSKPILLAPHSLWEPKIGMSLLKIKERHCRYEAVGTKSGFDIRYTLYPCWNLTGGLYGAVYYGKRTIHFPGPIDTLDRFEELVLGSTLSLGLEYLFRQWRFSASWEENWYQHFAVHGGVVGATIYY